MVHNQTIEYRIKQVIETILAHTIHSQSKEKQLCIRNRKLFYEKTQFFDSE